MRPASSCNLGQALGACSAALARASRSFFHLVWVAAVLAGCSDDAGLGGPTAGEPGIDFVDVHTDRHDVVPCLDTLACNVPSSARVTLRLTPAGASTRITGLQWRLQRPGRPPGPWEPFGETEWLETGRNAAATDSTGEALWALQNDTLSVHFNAAEDDTISALGTLLFLARARLSAASAAPLESERALTVFAPPPPFPIFLGVQIHDPGVPPCAAAEPCTIPTFVPFTVRFTGGSTHDWIRGFSWQAEPGLWEPYGSFAEPPFLPAGHDTVAQDGLLEPVTLWALSGDIVSVHARPAQGLSTFGWAFRYGLLPPGPLVFRARVRDDAGAIGSDERLLHLGFPPDTRLYDVPSCDCPRPAPSCGTDPPARLGWVTGIYARTFAPQDWIPFCDGDTLPNGSRVRFYARGSGDPRNHPPHPGGQAEVQYRFRSESRRATFEALYEPYSSPAVAPLDLPLPDGGLFRGGSVEFTACPLDYVVQAAAVDELRMLDRTPASIRFYVGGAPALDNIYVPPVFVCVPACGPNSTLCPPVPPHTAFGPDTVVVLGRHVPDDPDAPRTPLGLGYNDFLLPFRAWGHDSPRDRNGPGRDWYVLETEGRIRSWLVRFDCTEPGCRDIQLPSEGVWQADVARSTDPPGQQVFDEGLLVRIPLDTLCLAPECPPGSTALRAQIDASRFGPYEFSLRGRDTEVFRENCARPSDLGPDPAIFLLNIAPLGLTTEEARRRTIWRQLADVRPMRPPPVRRPF